MDEAVFQRKRRGFLLVFGVEKTPSLRQSEVRHFAGKGAASGEETVATVYQELRRMAIERPKSCYNVVAFLLELGVHRGLLYHWRENGERFEDGEHPLGDSSESKLRVEVGGMKQAISDKTLELDFFNGALQKVEV